MQNTVLRRFKKFKSMIVSSNISNSVLMDMIEDFITSEDDDLTIENIPILEGQLSLFDMPDYKELVSI